MKIGIYKITNLKNGKFYIGSSKDMDRRWYEHINELNKNIHINKKLNYIYGFLNGIPISLQFLSKLSK